MRATQFLRYYACENARSFVSLGVCVRSMYDPVDLAKYYFDTAHYYWFGIIFDLSILSVLQSRRIDYLSTAASFSPFLRLSLSLSTFLLLKRFLVRVHKVALECSRRNLKIVSETEKETVPIGPASWSTRVAAAVQISRYLLNTDEVSIAHGGICLALMYTDIYFYAG